MRADRRWHEGEQNREHREGSRQCSYGSDREERQSHYFFVAFRFFAAFSFAQRFR